MVHLSVIEGENDHIFTCDLNTYPNYKAGDKLFLQDTTHETPMKLSEYKILDIHHSLRNRSVLGSGATIASIEIYVRKIE